MSKIDSDVSVLSLILNGQTEVREDIKELANSVSAQGANITNISVQLERVLDTIESHGRLLAKHSERFSSLEATQESYYRYNKNLNKVYKDPVSTEESPKSFIPFLPQSTPDILKFVFFSLLSLGAVVGGVLKVFGIISF